MEFKGTKGEWKYNVKHRGSTKKSLIQVLIPKRENYNQVLELGEISDEECTVPSCCCSEEHANALLISKAPEMLYLLRDLLQDKGLNEVSRREVELLIKSATDLEGGKDA